MKKQRKFVTNFLCSTPSFWVGAGSAINIAGDYYLFNTSEQDAEADSMALYSDFGMVGQDLTEAIENFRKLHQDKVHAIEE